MPGTPAVEGWFTVDDEPRLIGSRCRECGTYHFPKETSFCRNSACASTELEELALSSRGTLWSWTVNYYPPPPPSVAQPPYGVAAVELAEEKMVVLGQIAGTTDGLQIGDAMRLVVEPLDDEQVVWKWSKA